MNRGLKLSSVIRLMSVEDIELGSVFGLFIYLAVSIQQHVHLYQIVISINISEIKSKGTSEKDFC